MSAAYIVDIVRTPVGKFAGTLALILNALANRFIRRDEQLVRSVDRLR